MANSLNISSLSDAELEALPRQLQEITMKALDAVGADMGAGRLTPEAANEESKRLIDLQVAQLDLCLTEIIRRGAAARKKRSLISIVMILAAGLATLVYVLLK